ncbi:MAG: hypothetical protein WC651_01705, partial [Candidatus Gracilibacteria bacterium]
MHKLSFSENRLCFEIPPENATDLPGAVTADKAPSPKEATKPANPELRDTSAAPAEILKPKPKISTLTEIKAALSQKEGLQDVTEIQIRQALSYYYFDEYKTSHGRSKTTEKILNAIKAMISAGTLDVSKFAFLGGVDATNYSIKKINKKQTDWHQEKAYALEFLLDQQANIQSNESLETLLSAETKGIINEYIFEATENSDLSAIQTLIANNEEVFTNAKGIFNMALCVQRANLAKERISDSDLSPTDIIYLEFGSARATGSQRRSSLLLKNATGDLEIPQEEKIPTPKRKKKTAPQKVERGSSTDHEYELKGNGVTVNFNDKTSTYYGIRKPNNIKMGIDYRYGNDSGDKLIHVWDENEKGVSGVMEFDRADKKLKTSKYYKEKNLWDTYQVTLETPTDRPPILKIEQKPAPQRQSAPASPAPTPTVAPARSTTALAPRPAPTPKQTYEQQKRAWIADIKNKSPLDINLWVDEEGAYDIDEIREQENKILNVISSL